MDLDMGIDLIAVALLAVAFTLLLVTVLGARATAPAQTAPDLHRDGPVFLFDGEVLVDCNSAARAVLAGIVTRGGDWQRLMSFLSQHFEKIDEKLAELDKRGALAETAEIGNGKIMLMQAEMAGGLLRIALDDPDLAEGPGVTLAIAHHALEREVQDLRHAVALAPVLIWRETASGDVVWANNAYLSVAAKIDPRGRDVAWPLPRLFDGLSDEKTRHQLPNGTGKGLWFDLIAQPEALGRLCYALPVDAVVAAETNLRDFMDTLAKTFAQLPIGLAVFDKDRVLQMFNPALVELTTLPPDFLARRPSLMAVLDALRNRNLLPEPKDYHGWRRQIVEMERAAASGLFQENWALPDGQTFRVTGRPHPNGGIALMMEDISSETQRSRRYRSDLEISQSVIDQLHDAIAVFSQSGQLLWCNAAYSELWGHDPSSGLGDAALRSVAAQWKAMCAPTSLWVEIDEFVHTVGLRTPWEKDLRLLDGRLVRCAVSPIAAGAAMIAFKCTPAIGPSSAVPNAENLSGEISASQPLAKPAANKATAAG